MLLIFLPAAKPDMYMDTSMGMTMTSSASGESATGTSGSGSNGNGQVKVHVVRVGSMDGGLAFVPNDLKAEKGDMVQFQFMPKVRATLSPVPNIT